jgi:hypothetical protein
MIADAIADAIAGAAGSGASIILPGSHLKRIVPRPPD